MNIRGYQYQVSSITNLENIKYQVSAYKQYESETFIDLKLSVLSIKYQVSSFSLQTIWIKNIIDLKLSV